MINKVKKILIVAFVAGLITSVMLVIFMNRRINKQTESSVFDCVEVIPENKVGLLLGTSKLLKSGSINPFFYNRIVATVELFEAGKIEVIVVSGDNSRELLKTPSIGALLF